MFVKGDKPNLEACRRGGRNVPADKRSFSQNKELARSAGRKGGLAIPAEARSFYVNRDQAREAGRKGGSAKRRPREVTP